MRTVELGDYVLTETLYLPVVSPGLYRRGLRRRFPQEKVGTREPRLPFTNRVDENTSPFLHILISQLAWMNPLKGKRERFTVTPPEVSVPSLFTPP